MRSAGSSMSRSAIPAWSTSSIRRRCDVSPPSRPRRAPTPRPSRPRGILSSPSCRRAIAQRFIAWTAEMLLLSRADVARLMDFPAYVDAVEAGFRAAAAGKALAPPAAGFAVPGGSYHAKGAALLGDTVAIKLNANFPGNPASNGLPTVQGVIYLSDARDGRPLALMDSIEITINRTGAATALAARHLSRPDSKTTMICGAGVQGKVQLRAIAATMPLERVNVWDVDGGKAERYAQEMSAALGFDVAVAKDLTAARDCDIVVTCTSARQAFLTRDHIRPGTFIS